MRQLTKGWMFLFSVACLTTLMMGLAVVWLSIERTHMAYGLRKMESKLTELESLASKLRVERDNLVSPYRLRQLAVEYGLSHAATGQIRRLEK
jgi:cell division protein FtsL